MSAEYCPLCGATLDTSSSRTADDCPECGPLIVTVTHMEVSR